MPEMNAPAVVAEPPQKVTIEYLQGLSDAELSKLLGLDAELALFKEKLTEAASLTGEPRKMIEDKITQRLQPDLDAQNMCWWLDDAKRMASKKGLHAMGDCSPCSVMD